MRVNLQINNRHLNNLTFSEALELADHYYAIHGDSPTTIIDVSTNKVVNEFQIEGSQRWYTFEELIELSYYKVIEVVDSRLIS